MGLVEALLSLAFTRNDRESKTDEITLKARSVEKNRNDHSRREPVFAMQQPSTLPTTPRKKHPLIRERKAGTEEMETDEVDNGR